MDIQPIRFICSLKSLHTAMEVRIGDIAVMMLPVADVRVAIPRLKNMKYTENPSMPERKNHSRSFARKGFRMPQTLPIMRSMTAASAHLMKPRE